LIHRVSGVRATGTWRRNKTGTTAKAIAIKTISIGLRFVSQDALESWRVEQHLDAPRNSQRERRAFIYLAQFVPL
jgi:hypothetical protein